MGEVRFGVGDIVFREGEPSETILLIAEGEVEVLKEMRGGRIVLGRAGAGGVVGEMGVIEGQPRSATVRANTVVAGELLDHDAFLARISGDRDLAFTILLRLSERLRAANEWLAETAPQPVAAGGDDQVVLSAAVAAGTGLVTALGGTGVVIDRFPFVVGRRPGRGETVADLVADLMLDDVAPYRLSRRHFAILRTADGELAVGDAQSRLGTIVNGESIGGPFSRPRALLRRGENSVIAGGEGSQFAFRVTVG